MGAVPTSKRRRIRASIKTEYSRNLRVCAERERKMIDKIATSLRTFLCWLQSVDCDERVFDNVSKHGTFHMSLDELVAEVLRYIEVSQDRIHRRNVLVATLRQQVEKYKSFLKQEGLDLYFDEVNKR